MNKRILDGMGLWRSDKLARIQPEWIRAEYANWIPLALANGVFEADTRRIWATVYSYNRPEISFDDAEEIKREFCRVGLLFFWPDEPTGKLWGFFVGIDKAGRLPPESRVKKKHVETGPTPPVDALRHYIELTRARPLESSMVNQWLANGCLGSGSGKNIPSHQDTVNRAASEPSKSEGRSESVFKCQFFVVTGHHDKALEKQYPHVNRAAAYEEMAAWCADEKARHPKWKGIQRPLAFFKNWCKKIPAAGLSLNELRQKRSGMTDEGKALLEKAGGLIQ